MRPAQPPKEMSSDLGQLPTGLSAPLEKMVQAAAMTPEEREAAIQKGRDAVADALAYLVSVKVQDFNARVINLMDRIALPGFGTMAVSIDHGRYLLIYDPLFASRVSHNEVRATCEHEVIHILYEHIPRYLMQRKLAATDHERELISIFNNIGIDLADNELLAITWPDIKKPEQPLGYWVLPEQFDPPMPNDMAYEEYLELLLHTYRSRLQQPKKLYELARQILEKQSEALEKALNAKGGQDPAQDPGQGGQGQGPGDAGPQDSGDPSEQEVPGQGQGQSQGQGQGQSQSPSPSPSLQDLVDEIKDLDPLDQKVLEMLVKSMQKHIAWDQAKCDEGELHKLTEHGKSLIREAYQSHDKSRGTLPAHYVEQIRKLLTPASVSWTALLHDVVQRTRQTKKSRGMSKPSKKLSALKVFATRKEEENDPRFQHYQQVFRMPVFPGIRHDNKFTIAYLLDTSGSMSSADLQKGLSELQHIQKADSDVRVCVVYIDAAVGKEYWIGPNDAIDEDLTGRGGTDFEAGFIHVAEMCRRKEDAPDILVYCTDGFAPPPDTKLPIPTVWLLTPRGEPVMSDAGHITIYMKDYQLEDADI